MQKKRAVPKLQKRMRPIDTGEILKAELKTGQSTDKVLCIATLRYTARIRTVLETTGQGQYSNFSAADQGAQV